MSIFRSFPNEAFRNAPLNFSEHGLKAPKSTQHRPKAPKHGRVLVQGPRQRPQSGRCLSNSGLHLEHSRPTSASHMASAGSDQPMARGLASGSIAHHKEDARSADSSLRGVAEGQANGPRGQPHSQARARRWPAIRTQRKSVAVSRKRCARTCALTSRSSRARLRNVCPPECAQSVLRCSSRVPERRPLNLSERRPKAPETT